MNNEWVDTKTNSGHSIYSMFSGDTERPNKNYVELVDYEKLERELNETRIRLDSLLNWFTPTEIHMSPKLKEIDEFLRKGTE